MSFQSNRPYDGDEYAPQIVHVEWQGRTKYTYYDDGIVKITRYKAKKRIYWGRIIAALVVFVLLIMGIVQLIKACAAALSKDRSIKQNDSMPSHSQSQTDTTDENSSPDITESLPPEEQNETAAYSDISIKVCLDAGHGDYDTGTIYNNDIIESEQNLEIAKLTRDYLESCGVTVIMTRDEDVQVSLSERCSMANQSGADFFVSFHRNTSPESAYACGVETWVNSNRPEYDTALAQNIMNAITAVGVTQDRGVKFGYNGIPDQNYQVNMDTVMPSCIIELGFITDDSDNALFESNKESYAKAIGDAIIKTAVDLQVINENGERLLGEQLISSGKTNVYENY